MNYSKPIRNLQLSIFNAGRIRSNWTQHHFEPRNCYFYGYLLEELSLNLVGQIIESIDEDKVDGDTKWEIRIVDFRRGLQHRAIGPRRARQRGYFLERALLIAGNEVWTKKKKAEFRNLRVMKQRVSGKVEENQNACVWVERETGETPFDWIMM